MMRAAATTLALAFVVAAIPSHAAESAREAGATFRDCDGCPEMIVIPAGSFVMGTAAAERATGAGAAEGEVVVMTLERPFALSKHEVTRGEYSRFIADSGYEPQSGCRVWDPALSR